MTGILIGKIQWPFLAQLYMLQPEHKTLVNKSGMIIIQTERTIDQKMVAVAWVALYNTSP
jgi:hypothetical protein